MITDFWKFVTLTVECADGVKHITEDCTAALDDRGTLRVAQSNLNLTVFASGYWNEFSGIKKLPEGELYR